MGDRDTSRRILDQLGEDETLLSTDYRLADLKLFGPAFVIGFVIVGMMPSGWSLLGLVLGGLVVVGAAGIIWKAPPHRVAHDWFTDAASFHWKKLRGKTLMLPHDSDDDTDARTLTNVDSVLRRWNSVRRTDSALVGGMQVHPANMALGDEDDWEDAADALAGFLGSISFDVQIYSTARPVDASEIVEPYRERLGDPDVRNNDRLRSVIRAYRDRLPEEFERRRTSIREYYIFVAVSETEAKLSNQGVIESLRDAPYVGKLFEVVGRGRSDMSDGEILVRQQRELNSRLRSVRRGITELPDCRPEQVSAARMADLLEEFWTGEPSHYDESKADNLRFHEMPVIRPDDDRDPTERNEPDEPATTALDSDSMTNSQQVATDGGTEEE
jgi:hypothetical protein